MDMSIDRQIDRRINGHTQLEAVKVQNYKLKLDIQVDKMIDSLIERQKHGYVNR